MKKTKKPCSGCGLDKFIWKNHEGKKYCIDCWKGINPPKSIQTFKKPKPVSTKRTIEQKQYSVKRKKLLEDNPYCQASIRYVCTYNATECHHMRGRVGDLYLDEENFLAVCHECHEWIELHPKEAKELGFSKSRLEKE